MSNLDQYLDAPARLLLDSIPLPVRIIGQSADGKPVYRWFNRAATIKTGRSLDRLMGKSAEDVFPDKWGIIATQQHSAVFQSVQPLTYTHKMLLAAGLRTLQTTLVPVRMNEDSGLHIVASTVDITEHTKNESEWLKAGTISQEIREFTALTAHDLRAPLLQIGAFAEIIKEDFEDLGDGKLDKIDKIKEIAQRATDLVSSLLKSSSNMASNVSSIETFDMNTLCKDLFSLLDPLSYHNLSHDMASITADRTSIQMVLRNLVDNALKHNHPNVVNVNIAVTSNTDVQGQLKFTVTDNGRGLKNLDDVMVADGADSSKAGHGLPAIKRLIQARGGTISTDPHATDEGATVTFVFPGTLG